MNEKDIDYAVDEAKDAIVATVGEMARKVDLLDKLDAIRELAKRGLND